MNVKENLNENNFVEDKNYKLKLYTFRAICFIYAIVSFTYGLYLMGVIE